MHHESIFDLYRDYKLHIALCFIIFVITFIVHFVIPFGIYYNFISKTIFASWSIPPLFFLCFLSILILNIRVYLTFSKNNRSH